MGKTRRVAFVGTAFFLLFAFFVAFFFNQIKLNKTLLSATRYGGLNTIQKPANLFRNAECFVISNVQIIFAIHLLWCISYQI